MSEIVIKVGDRVTLKGTRVRGKIVHLYGKGTAGDPHCATITIPAQTVPIRLARILGKDEHDG